MSGSPFAPPRLLTPRLILLPLTREIVVRQLAGQPFTLDLPELGSLRFDTEWPGDAFGFFPELAGPSQRFGGWILIHAGEATGMIGPKGSLSGAVDIGYGLRSQSWNRGFASEAVQAVCGWLLTLPLFTADTAVGNLASARVLEKSGFVEVGRGYGEKDGELRLWALARPGN